MRRLDQKQRMALAATVGAAILAVGTVACNVELATPRLTIDGGALSSAPGAAGATADGGDASASNPSTVADDGGASSNDAGASAADARAPSDAAAGVDASAPMLPPGAPFATRCAQPGVIKCVGFDDPSDFDIGAGGTNGAYGKRAGIMPPSGTSDYSRATRDTTVRASGASSLKFTIPANSPADASGSYFTNFSDDLSARFGASSEFFVQWRQRMSAELVSTKFAGGGGWKQIIVGTGDTPTAWYASCTALETVVQNLQHRGFPASYNSCTGSTSHGAYYPFEEPFGSYDFKLQNARPAPYCLYSQSQTSYFPPVGNCMGYVPDEWMTFQFHIKTGPRVGDEFAGSYVDLWVAREGKPSEQVLAWGPFNLTAGDPTEDQRYGKLWLLPYNTGKDASVTNPVAYTWYDDLIISRTKIADP